MEIKFQVIGNYHMFESSYGEDMKVLMTHSGYARHYGYDFTISGGAVEQNSTSDFLSIFCGGDGSSLWGPAEDDTFHPVNSGCIKLADSYLFGIRCDHLIWIDFDDYGDNRPKTLLLANHKGIFTYKLITYEQELHDDE